MDTEDMNTVIDRVSRSIWTDKIVSVTNYFAGEIGKDELSPSEVFSIPQVTCGSVVIKIHGGGENESKRYIYWNPKSSYSFDGYYMIEDLNIERPTNRKINLATIEHYLSAKNYTVTFTPIESIMKFTVTTNIDELPNKIAYENTDTTVSTTQENPQSIHNLANTSKKTVLTRSGKEILTSTMWKTTTYPFCSYIASNGDHNHKPTVGQYRNLLQSTGGEITIGWRKKGERVRFVHHYYIDEYNKGSIYCRPYNDEESTFFASEVTDEDITRLLDAPSWEFVIGSIYNLAHPEISAETT